MTDDVMKLTVTELPGPVKDWRMFGKDLLIAHDDGTISVIRKGTLVPFPELQVTQQLVAGDGGAPTIELPAQLPETDR